MLLLEEEMRRLVSMIGSNQSITSATKITYRDFYRKTKKQEMVRRSRWTRASLEDASLIVRGICERHLSNI